MADRKRKREEAVAMETTTKGKEKESKPDSSGEKEKIDPDIKEALMREAFALKKIKKELALDKKVKRPRETVEKTLAVEVSHLPIKPEEPAPEAPTKKPKLNPQEEAISTHKYNLVEFLREVVDKDKHKLVDELEKASVEEFIQMIKIQAVPLWKIGMINTVVDMIMLKAEIGKENIKNFENSINIFRNTMYLLCKMINTMK